MSRRSVLGALCAGNGALVEMATTRIAGQRRTFTSTVQRNARISHFTPTSSPELDELLSTIRHKIILPAYLPYIQRKRIYSPKWEKKLQSDPIIIEIDGEILKFRHEDRFSLPPTQQSALSAIRQFETPADFANLRPLLEGLAYAGRKLRFKFWTSMIRRVGEKGRISLIIDCAVAVERTNLRLDSSEKVNEVMHWLQMAAIDSEWDETKTRKALRRAELVLDLLQEEGHQPKRPKGEPPIKGEFPLYRDPMVLLAPLHLAAGLVSRYEVDENVVDRMNQYARDVVMLWPEGKKLTELYPEESFEDEANRNYLIQPNIFIAFVTPLIAGLETTIKEVKPELASQLQSRLDALKLELQQAQAANDRIGRGSQVYEKIYGTQEQTDNSGEGGPLNEAGAG
ncbi:hypothetical protein F5B20DRAFT_532824 [Whalleya microplaca]|nr:hypothetical protein F5B20DRAFT_532824 [Whalleya microplaca]